MKTFAGDGIANIDNFAVRIDVTSAMVGDDLTHQIRKHNFNCRKPTR